MNRADGPMIHDTDVGHDVRRGDWAAQGESTYVLAARAVGEGRYDDAVKLLQRPPLSNPLCGQPVEQLRV